MESERGESLCLAFVLEYLGLIREEHPLEPDCSPGAKHPCNNLTIFAPRRDQGIIPTLVLDLLIFAESTHIQGAIALTVWFLSPSAASTMNLA